MSTNDTKTRLTAAIRGWVHFDNLVEKLNHQATNARELRMRHETETLTLLKQLNMTATTVHISGAQLQYATRREPTPLTWTYLEEQLPRWAAHAGVNSAQAQSLLKWLQEHREYKDKDYLKKSVLRPKPGDPPLT